MAQTAYSERLVAALDGARLVKYDPDGFLYAWFGGQGVNIYETSTGVEVDYFSLDYSRTPTYEEVAEAVARHVSGLDDVLERAVAEGYDHGKAAGSWLLDGNSTVDAARRLLQGIENGDPEVMDALPSCPLSGEYADGLLPRDVLGWFDMDEEHDAAEDVLRAFEDGYRRGVEDEAVRSARAMLDD